MALPGLRRHAPRLGAFASSVAVTAVVGIVAIPLVIHIAGASVWGVIALGQSVAMLFGVVVSFGWGTTGPAMVAALEPSRRPLMYQQSLVSRTYLYVIAAPVATVVVLVAASSHRGVGLVACLTYMIPFLGGSWYFVGNSKPGKLFLLDTLPQAVGTACGLLILLLTQQIFAFLLSQFTFNILAVVLAARYVRRSGSPLRTDLRFRPAMQRLYSQRHGLITAATSSLYVNTPLIAISAILPGGLAVYALADKFFRYALTAFGPVVQVLQGTIPDTDKTKEQLRIKRASIFSPALGIIGGAFVALLSPWASRILSAGQLSVGIELSIPMGAVFAGVAISQVVGLACLIPLNQGRSLATSTIVGAVIGIPLIIAGALTSGVVAVAWAVAISEIAVACYQLRILSIHFRNARRR